MDSANDELRPVAVNVSLQELRDDSVSLKTLEQAFGPASLGIIIVRDLPHEYAKLRQTLLSYSSFLANLPEVDLNKIEVPTSNYNVGWSCGKETLADGRYDTLKGSFYAQPIDNPALRARAQQAYPHLPEFTTPNVWPDPHTLPGFEPTFLALCRLIVDVAALVARNCDRYGAATIEGYQPGTLERIVRESVSTKARLLHYFPGPATPLPSSSSSSPPDDEAAPKSQGHDGDGDGDDWCATHLDLGALTGLTSAMFVDESAPTPRMAPDGPLPVPVLAELDAHPDPRAGLWIKDRAGRTTQVRIPRDCLAFQTGQALQSITRDKFRAVPHFVRGGSAAAATAATGGKGGTAKIARNTLAVFTQPNLWDMVDESRDFATMAKEVLGKTI